MASNTDTPDPAALLHARLHAAADTGRRLDVYIEFLRAPGNIASDVQLAEADCALLTDGIHRNHLPAAELRILRARLRGTMRQDAPAHHDGALADLAEAMLLCGDDTSPRAASLMIETASVYAEIGNRSAALTTLATAARTCEDNAGPAQPRTRKRDAVHTDTREHTRNLAVEEMLKHGRYFDHAQQYDEALSAYRMAGQACGSITTSVSNPRAKAPETPERIARMRLRAAAYLGEGNALLHREQFSDALAALLPALELSTTLNHATMANTEMVMVAQAAVARVYARQGSPRAGDVYLRSLETARACERKAELAAAVAEAYEHLADASIALGRTDDARDRTRRAATIYHELGDELAAIRMNIATGDILILESRLKDAATTYAEAYTLLESRGEIRLLARLLLKIAHLHRAMRQLNRSILWLLQALGMADELGDKRIQRDAQFAISATYEEMGQFAKALRHHKLAVALERAVAESDGRQAIAALQGGFDPEQARRTEGLLRATQQELVRRSNRLGMLGVQLVHRAERLKCLLQQARELAGALHADSYDTLPAPLPAMLADLAETLRSDTIWESYLEQIEDLHPNAMRRLSERYPKLTKTERKVCALKLLNLSTKDVATTLCSEVRTIDKHVQRIRVKVGVGGGDDLVGFLQVLGDEAEQP